MSAQPSAQTSGLRSQSALFQRMRGTLASATQGNPVAPPAPVTPPTPVAPPVTQPVEEAVPEPAPQPSPQQIPVVEEVPVLSEHAAAPEQTVSSQPAVPPEPQVEEAPQEVATEALAESVAAAVPMAVNAMTDTLNPPNAVGGTAKEAPQLSVTVEHPAIDQAGGVQYVEAERSHELPPEVEGFLKKVEDHMEQVPQEIVIADPQSGQALPRVLAQPVVVLPISVKDEEEGKREPPAKSIRWLIEWSWKMMKRFSGKVVYREDGE